LRSRLEAAASERQTNTTQLMRQLLEGGLAEPSLADFRANWLRKLRDAIETGVPKQDIEAGWRVNLAIEAEWAKFFGAIERKLSSSEGKLSPPLRIPRVRELLLGAPNLPNKTTSKHKP
jgi:hypothetical protein